MLLSVLGFFQHFPQVRNCSHSSPQRREQQAHICQKERKGEYFIERCGSFLKGGRLCMPHKQAEKLRCGTPECDSVEGTHLNPARMPSQVSPILLSSAVAGCI
ncbi:Hypothetical predicted protein [Podarcis lilfordi]|uniref:Uncharacterized protein n=1 Tax=Podarcis lilfordi TaxID=74358 RepID=A0AA35NX57_9SAUR|nr:Hypothetical predicted protein [Podarcis lilfordi]